MVALSPKAITFFEAAAEDHVRRYGNEQPLFEIIKDWKVSNPSQPQPGVRQKILVPDTVAKAFLALIALIVESPDQTINQMGWDENDIAFLDGVGRSIEQELRASL